MFTRLSRLLGLSRPAGSRRQGSRRPARARLCCESLETRAVPAVLGEFMVNAEADLNQNDPASATSADGSRSVVVWTHQYSVNDLDIRAQIYDGSGDKVGGEIWVAYTGYNESAPSVGMDDAGNFAVAWTLDNNGNQDIHAARFTADGTLLAHEFVVANSSYNEYDPDVAVSPNGTLVVGYTLVYSPSDYDVYAQVFHPNNAHQATIYVDTSYDVEWKPSVASSGDDSFVIAYEKLAHGFTSSSDIYVSRYNLLWSGSVRMYRSQVDVGGRNDSNPDVAVDVNGEAMVVYQSYIGTDWDIYGRRVGATGYTGNPEVIISNTYANETNPSIALGRSANGEGTGVVAYNSRSGPDGHTFIYAQEDPFGGYTRSTIWISGSDNAYGMGAPSVSIAENGRYLVSQAFSWYSPYDNYTGVQDVYAQFGDWYAV